MSASTSLQLSPEDKLDILRYLDEFHFWHSLDDERRCQRCGKSITGRQIMIIELKGTRGKMRLQCPTAGCLSSPSEWVYANPVLAAKLRRDFRPSAQRLSAKSEPAQRPYHGQAFTVPRRKHSVSKNAAADGPFPSARVTAPPVSIRAVLARLLLLRPVVSGLHTFHPIA